MRSGPGALVDVSTFMASLTSSLVIIIFSSDSYSGGWNSGSGALPSSISDCSTKKKVFRAFVTS